MITCHKRFLEQRCVERGYLLEEVMQCVISQNGGEWTIDVDHPAYPRETRSGFESPDYEAATPPPQSHGPGTQLHALLGKFGLTASGDCKCRSRAAYLDHMGCDWAESNLDEIVGWLRESAAERGLPFLDVAARLLVRRAISNARRKAAANAQRPPHHDRGEEVAPPVHDAPR